MLYVRVCSFALHAWVSLRTLSSRPGSWDLLPTASAEETGCDLGPGSILNGGKRSPGLGTRRKEAQVRQLGQLCFLIKHLKRLCPEVLRWPLGHGAHKGNNPDSACSGFSKNLRLKEDPHARVI